MKKGSRKKSTVALGANVGELLTQAQDIAKNQAVAETVVAASEPVETPVGEVQPQPQPQVEAPATDVVVETPVAVAEETKAPEQAELTGVRYIGLYMHKPEDAGPEDVVYNVVPREQRPAMTGVLLVGPKHKHHSDDRGLVPSGIRAYRFVINYGRLGRKEDRGAPIASKPGISPDWYVRFTCCCGTTEVALNHVTFERDFLQRWKQDKAGRICPTCGKRASRDNLGNTLLPQEAGYAVFQKADDPILQHFEKSWQESDMSVSEVLPRLWALYPIQRTPFDWAPSDKLAKEIDARARKSKGLTIRPFVESYRSKSPHIVGVVCETAYTLKCGWVREADLSHTKNDPEFGWTRQFGYEPELSGF